MLFYAKTGRAKEPPLVKNRTKSKRFVFLNYFCKNLNDYG